MTVDCFKKKTLFFYLKRFSEALREWTQRLGKTYGYYEGHYPILVTSDSNMIQEVFIKQFSNFTGRKHVPAQYTDENDQVNVGTASKATWKRHRTILNPTFSPGYYLDF
jgi:cytochrome P450